MRLITALVILAVATVVAEGSAAGSRGSLRPDDSAAPRGPGSISGASLLSVRPDDRAGAKGPGSIGSVTVASVHPDDRAGARGPGSIDSAPVASVHPDDRAGVRGPGAFAVPNTAPNVEIVRVSSDAFDWPAAFVGAASTLGLCLLLGAALLLRPQGRRTATS
jgi:hypothetical protein